MNPAYYINPYEKSIRKIDKETDFSKSLSLQFYRYLKLLFLFLILSHPVFSAGIKAEENTLVEITGILKNSKNKKPIENVSVTLLGTNIGTVTNADGYFSIKAPESLLTQGLKAEQIGYSTLTVPVKPEIISGGGLTLFMQPTGKVLDEVLVLGGDPEDIVKMALRKIPENYDDKDNLFTGFYRETISKGKRYINISEGMVDVLKKSYRHRDTAGEKVRISRGRSLVSPKPSDTLSVKLMGGPYMPVVLDAVKNGEHLFREDEMPFFDFKMETPAKIDDRLHYAISFKPKVKMSYPLYSGTFFIDGENLSISRVEFSLDMSEKNKVTNAILQKKPAGLKFRPLEVSGIVSYKTKDGKSYINYIASKVRFKCDWKKRLFSSAYTSEAEMVMVDRTVPDSKVKFSDSFSGRKIFSDMVLDYWDEDFWKDYNIIEPTESLEKAVNKLKKQ